MVFPRFGNRFQEPVCSLQEYSPCESFLGRWCTIQPFLFCLVLDTEALKPHLDQMLYLSRFFQGFCLNFSCDFIIRAHLCDCAVEITQYIYFLSSRLFWLLCCMNRPIKAWPFSPLAFTHALLVSSKSGVVCDHSFPLVGRIGRNVSVLSQHRVLRSFSI